MGPGGRSTRASGESREALLAIGAAYLKRAAQDAGRWANNGADISNQAERRILGAEVIDLLQQVTARIGETSESEPPNIPARRPAAERDLPRSDELAAQVGIDLAAAAEALYFTAQAPSGAVVPVDAGGLTIYADTREAREKAKALLTEERRDRASCRLLGAQADDIRRELTGIRTRLEAQPEPLVPPTQVGHVLTGEGHTSAKPLADSAPTVGADATTQSLRASADKIRARVDSLGKTFGAIGTAGVTAIGVSRIDNLFPVPTGSIWLVVVAALSFVVGAGVVLAIAVRLSDAAGPLSLRSDLADMVAAGEISRTERDMVKDVYEQTYDLNAAKSLLAYEMRGIRLHRIGGWIGDASCVGACGTRSTEIAIDVSVSLARASVVVIRYRAAQAVTSRLAGVLYAAFVAAMVSFALSTSWLISRQSGDIATVKSCADAEAALISAGTTTFSKSVTLTTTSMSTTTTTIHVPPDRLKALPTVCRR
jgi:hypothetical protein